MKKQILTLLGAGLIGLMHPAASQAGPVDFTFSYTGAVNIGSVAGTVTGEIFGLTEGATSSATNVILDGYPASLGALSPPDAVFSDVSANSFTVSNSGQLTAADFNAQDATDTFVFILKYIGEESVLYDSSTGAFVFNAMGPDNITYTLVQPIPEPSSVTTLGTGLGLAALWQLRQRRRRQGAAAQMRHG
jgi:hypothetical protein